jgi:hypothetical protein
MTTARKKKPAPTCSRCPGTGVTWQEFHGKRTWFCENHLKEAEREVREAKWQSYEKPAPVTAKEETAAPSHPISNTAVDHPPHYNVGKFEVIDVIDDWSLSFNLGNVVKYVARAQHKGAELEDLEKAAWYIAREIARRKG